MKSINLILLFLSAVSGLAQSNIEYSNVKNDKYFTSQNEVKGKTAYTELFINASPENVRQVFLRLDQWPNWNSVIVKIEVLNGDITDISTKPRIDALFNMDTAKAPQPAPMKLWLTANNNQAFVWEVKNGLLLKAKHVYLFLPAEEGKATRLVHYEKMTGFLSLFFSEKLRQNMVDRYGLMNQELKLLCEK